MKTGYSVHDCMTTKPITISEDETIKKCASEMKTHHVGALVVKRAEKSIGIITEQDIVRKGVAGGNNVAPMKVKELMENELVTIGPKEDIYNALIKMRDYNIRHLPVVEDSVMIGLLTLKDILKIEPSLFELLVEKFNLREEARKPVSRIIKSEGLCEGCGVYVEKIVDVKGLKLCKRCAKEQS